VALFPQHFVEDVKRQADIVLVIQDYVSLKKTGATYKGLCPFHGEKTPSFHVNRDKGFFHCFGCQVGGDVIKFLELHEKIGFTDAVKQLAQRFGMALPELEQNDEQRANAAERETLLMVHEAAAAWFRAQLAAPAGARVRRLIADRGVVDATAEALGLGWAPPGRDGLKQAMTKAGFSPATLLRAGLLVQRDDGSSIDRFRNRLMIPICRDTGSVIAFGGRALEPDQQPKYLNSPETPIYSKGRTLYGLNLSKASLRRDGFAVLVEGYFDFAQVYQAGFQGVVASCGTALTAPQAQQLRRFVGKVVLSFDPDAAGQGAAAKSCELLATEGFEVNVAILPAGDDPDTYIQKHGRAGYGERLKQSQPYLEYLLDRAAETQDLRTAEGRARLVTDMIPVASRITDRVKRELFVEALAGRSRVSGETILAELRKSGNRRPEEPSRLEGITQKRETLDFGHVTKAEKGLIWWLVHQPAPALSALETLDVEDFAGLASRSVLDLARKLNEDRGFSPSVLLERLSMTEAQLVTAIASEPVPPTLSLGFCVGVIRRTRYERERATVQQDLERLQRSGNATDHDVNALLARKNDLVRMIQALVTSEE
jgi:DNA primase